MIPSKPTLLAPHLPSEDVALRYSASLTLLDLYGRTEAGETYSLRITRDGNSVDVAWNVSTLEPACSYKTVRRAYWRKPWMASFRSEAKAVAFATRKVEALRKWAAKRSTEAA